MYTFRKFSTKNISVLNKDTPREGGDFSSAPIDIINTLKKDIQSLQSQIEKLQIEKQASRNIASNNKSNSLFASRIISTDYFDTKIRELETRITYTNNKIQRLRDLSAQQETAQGVIGSIKAEWKFLWNASKPRRLFKSENQIHAPAKDNSPAPDIGNNPAMTPGVSVSTPSYDLQPIKQYSDSLAHYRESLGLSTQEKAKQKQDQFKDYINSQEYKNTPTDEKKKIIEAAKSLPETEALAVVVENTVALGNEKDRAQSIQDTLQTFSSTLQKSLIQIIKESPDIASKILKTPNTQNLTPEQLDDIHGILTERSENTIDRETIDGLKNAIDVNLKAMIGDYFLQIPESIQVELMEAFFAQQKGDIQNTGISFKELQVKTEFIDFFFSDALPSSIQIPRGENLGILLPEGQNFRDVYRGILRGLMTDISRVDSVLQAENESNDTITVLENQIERDNLFLKQLESEQTSALELTTEASEIVDKQEVLFNELYYGRQSLESLEDINLFGQTEIIKVRALGVGDYPVSIDINPTNNSCKINNIYFKLTSTDFDDIKKEIHMYSQFVTMPIVSNVLISDSTSSGQSLYSFLHENFNKEFPNGKYTLPDDSDKFMIYVYNFFLSKLNEDEGMQEKNTQMMSYMEVSPDNISQYMYHFQLLQKSLLQHGFINPEGKIDIVKIEPLPPFLP